MATAPELVPDPVPQLVPVPATQAVILVFGAGLRPDGTPTLTLARRVEAARSFGERLTPPPLYLPTGGIGRHPPAEAVAMATSLRASGIPASRILIEDTARDTLQSVRLCAGILHRRRHAGPVFAATSAYHLPRCLVLLRLAGVPAHPVPPPRHPASHAFLRRWRWRLREIPALPWDTLLLLGHRMVDKAVSKR